MAFLRQGDCNQCGQCCGAEGSPNQANPYPRRWPEAIARWSLDDANEVCPQLTMFGIVNQGDLIGYDSPTGNYKIRNDRYYYVWVPGSGCCKDTSVAHDGSSYSLECPFLEDDPGDGSRPCALVGTQDDGARLKFCRPEERPEPPPNYDVWDDRPVTQWQADHPLCSYTWTEG